MASIAERFISSMQGLLGKPQAREDLTPERLDNIREAMLETLGPVACIDHPHIERRILFATDLQALWYARADVMAVLSDQHGEKEARGRMNTLSRRFDGLLPAAMTERKPRQPR